MVWYKAHDNRVQLEELPYPLATFKGRKVVVGRRKTSWKEIRMSIVRPSINPIPTYLPIVLPLRQKENMKI